MSHNRVGDAIRLIDLAPSGEFRSDLRAQLLAEFLPEEPARDGVADLAAAPPPDPVEVYVTLTSDKSPRGVKRRLWKAMLAAAACLALVATGVVIANRDGQSNEPLNLRDVDLLEAEPLARSALIARQALGLAWVVGPSSPDTARQMHAAATIEAMPDCALLIPAGLFPPTTKTATAYQLVDGSNFLGQRIWVYATAEDASRAMDVIDGDAFAACWFDLFDRIRVAPVVGADATGASEPWNVPHVYGPLEKFEIAPHGDRQVIIGQHTTIGGVSGAVDRYFVNAFVQVGRAITWINPRFVVPNDTATSDSSMRSVGINEVIAAATTALENVFGS